MMGVLMALGWLLLTLLKIAGVLLLILLVLLAPRPALPAVRGRLLGGRRPDRPGPVRLGSPCRCSSGLRRKSPPNPKRRKASGES